MPRRVKPAGHFFAFYGGLRGNLLACGTFAHARFGDRQELNSAEHFTAMHPDDGRYGLLLDAIADYAIYMLDPNGTVASWNAGAQRIKGYKAGEIIGENFSRFYSDEDRANAHPQRALAAAAEHGSFKSEGWRIRKDGTRFSGHTRSLMPFATAPASSLALRTLP